MDSETLDGPFLGCSHERITTPASKMQGLPDSHPLYHPRASQGGASPHAKACGGDDDYAYKQNDPNRKAHLVVYTMEMRAKDCITCSAN